MLINMAGKELHIGEKVKNLVDSSPGTGRELANYLKIHDSSLSRIYKTKNVSSDTLKKIATYFKVDMNYFFSEDGKKETGKVKEPAATYGTYSIESLRTENRMLKEQNKMLQEMIDKFISRVNASITQ